MSDFAIGYLPRLGASEHGRLVVDVETSGPERLLPGWWALWERAANPLPFTAPGWMLAWWRHLGGGPLRVFTVRAEGRLVGLLPMFIYDDAGVRRLLPLGISASDAFDVLAAPGWEHGVTDALAEALQAPGRDWDRCELHEVPAGSVLRHLAPHPRSGEPERGLAQSAPGAAEQVQSVSPVLDLGRFAALPARSGARRRLTRAQRAAAQAGVTFDRPGTEALESLFRLHAAQWQARGEAGVLHTPALQAFHWEAAAALHAIGALRLHRARHGAQTVGVLYGFTVRSRCYAYLTGIDPAHAELGLGTALIGEAIGAAQAEGARSLDFLRGAEPYKYAWGAADQMLLRLDLAAEPSATRHPASSAAGATAG